MFDCRRMCFCSLSINCFLPICLSLAYLFPGAANAAGQWGAWNQVAQCPGISIRVKYKSFNKFSNKDVYDVGVKNDNPFKVHVGIRVTPIGGTANTDDRSWYVPPLGGTYTFPLNFVSQSPDPGPVMVWLFKVRNSDANQPICSNVSVQATGGGSANVSSNGGNNTLGNIVGTSTGGSPVFTPPPPPPPPNGFLEATINDPVSGVATWAAPVTSAVFSAAGQKITVSVREKTYPGQTPAPGASLYVDCYQADFLLINGKSCSIHANSYGVSQPSPQRVGPLNGVVSFSLQWDPKFTGRLGYNGFRAIRIFALIPAPMGKIYGRIDETYIRVRHDLLAINSNIGTRTLPLFITVNGVKRAVPTTVHTSQPVNVVAPYNYFDNMGNEYRFSNTTICAQTPGPAVGCQIKPSLLDGKGVFLSYQKYVPLSAAWRKITVKTVVDGKPAPGMMVYAGGGTGAVYNDPYSRPSPATWTYWGGFPFPGITAPNLPGYTKVITCGGGFSCANRTMSTNQTVTVSYTPVRQFGSDDGILANGDLITVSFRTLRASLRLFGGGFSGRPPAHINITDPVNPPVDSIQTTPTFDYLMVGTPVGGATSIDLSVLRTPAGSAATTSVDLTNAQLFSIDDTGSYSLVPSELWTRIDKWTIQVNQTDGGKIDLDGMQNGQIRNRLILLSAAAHASTAIQATSSTTVAATPTSSSSNGGGGGGGCLLGTNFRAAIVIPLLLMIGLVGLMRRRRLSY